MTTLTFIKHLQHAQMTILRMKHMLDINDLTDEEKNEMVDPKVAAIITEFDNATNAIAARIQRLIDGGGLNAESQAALQAEVAKLTALGSDPADPIPAA
jgi:hypothetical protein